MEKYTPEYLKRETPEIFEVAAAARSTEELRRNLSRFVFHYEYEIFDNYDDLSDGSILRVRDSTRAFLRMLTRRSEDKAGFSITQAMRDIARGVSRPDLSPAFYAELLHLLLGLRGKGPGKSLTDLAMAPTVRKGRLGAYDRSRQLDKLSAEVGRREGKIIDGLQPESLHRRRRRREHIQKELGASDAQWHDWSWQLGHILRDADTVARCVRLSDREKQAIALARQHGIPFGITPYYLSLMDDDYESGDDRAIRVQVIPSHSYIEGMQNARRDGTCLDFMRESDTSPIDLITRRYPGICILKPFNTCPQICVYCQRNWEVRDAMETGSLAPREKILEALEWIRKRPEIREVLVTGGDPLAMNDADLREVLEGVAAIPSIERIRIGSRVPVTLPMRITDDLADWLASLRLPGRRQIAIVTHVQHPYEVTPEMVAAVERLRSRGIPVFNQLVYTFYVSRRFEACVLRRLLAKTGIEPYYTFYPKGKEETESFRVPIARLLQEQKEEARLLPGLSRTDEVVFNVPGMGKNYLRGIQHRDLISILPNGARLYELHPWEKKITSNMVTYISEDVPILTYLRRLEEIGEDISDYGTIWYYY